MGKPERDKVDEILAAIEPHERLFRINAGMGYVGKVLRHEKGILVMENPRTLHAAPTGWPDLCGWTETEITPEMVGTKVAIFTGIEVKATGGLSKPQARFKETLELMGGVFKVAT